MYDLDHDLTPHMALRLRALEMAQGNGRRAQRPPERLAGPVSAERLRLLAEALQVPVELFGVTTPRAAGAAFDDAFRQAA